MKKLLILIICLTAFACQNEEAMIASKIKGFYNIPFKEDESGVSTELIAICPFSKANYSDVVMGGVRAGIYLEKKVGAWTLNKIEMVDDVSYVEYDRWQGDKFIVNKTSTNRFGNIYIKYTITPQTKY